MIPISHVKLYHGQIIDIRNKPTSETHYEMMDNILWIVPDHQKSKAEFMRTISAGRIIARGVNEKEVDIKVPMDFIHYLIWCSDYGFKAHKADTLITFMKQYAQRDNIKVVQT